MPHVRAGDTVIPWYMVLVPIPWAILAGMGLRGLCDRLGAFIGGRRS
jgi:hypothetical protein